MHQKGVCHLDMSFDNGMIAQRSKKYGNQIKIIDFGLAQYYPNKSLFVMVNVAGVSKTGYMAPYVFARKKYDPCAADIWSVKKSTLKQCDSVRFECIFLIGM